MPASTLTLFADYFQFYLQDDDDSKGDLSDSWTPEATERLLAVAPHVIGVGTVRNMDVPVEVILCEQRPQIDATEWDHIVHASLQVDSGRIVVAGCTDYYPDATRISVTPGHYEALACYGDLATLSEDGLQGDDRYAVFLFPGTSTAPQIIKNRNG